MDTKNCEGHKNKFCWSCPSRNKCNGLELLEKEHKENKNAVVY